MGTNSGIGDVNNPGVKVTSYSTHASLRMAQRGMTSSQVDDIVSKGVALAQGDTYYFLSRQGAAVLTKAGRVVTAYTQAEFYEETWALIWELGI